jgi:DNA-binding GntR family transcriptional regulator
MLIKPAREGNGQRRSRVLRQTVTEATVEAIRRKILLGEVGEGESLRQDALADELGVSRIPIREAFRQLEAEGLVTIVPHRGAVVSSFSVDEVAELFDLRALIEPDLLARAIPLMSEADLRGAASVLDRYEKSFSDFDVHLWGEMNKEFHLLLYRPSQRPSTLGLIQNLLVNTDRHVRLQLVMTRGVERASREHRQLLLLCRQKRADKAVALLRRHILAARDDLVAFLRRRRA